MKFYIHFFFLKEKNSSSCKALPNRLKSIAIIAPLSAASLMEDPQDVDNSKSSESIPSRAIAFTGTVAEVGRVAEYYILKAGSAHGALGSTEMA